MDQGARGWLFRKAHKNLWRVRSFYELDDLIQDGYLCYQLVINKYPQVKDRPHIMRLFQRTYSNYIHDLANQRTREASEVLLVNLLPAFLSEVAFWDRLLIDDLDRAALQLLIAQAPPPIKAVLRLFTDDRSLQKLRKPYRRNEKTGRETLNQRLCRLTGMNPELIDLPSELRAYLAR